LQKQTKLKQTKLKKEYKQYKIRTNSNYNLEK